MAEPLTLEQVRHFLQAVGTRLAEPTTLYLLGGCALRFLGHTRTTLDLDYVGADMPLPNDALATLLHSLAHEMQIEVEGVPLAEFIPLPPGAEARHQWVGQFGQLAVFVFDPYSIALSKLDRGFVSDLEDVRFLVQAGYLERERLEQFAAEVLRQAARFQIDPDAFQCHLAALHRLL